MKTLTLVFMTLFMLSVYAVMAQQSSQPQVTLGNAIQLTGTIVSINRAARDVTIQGPQGNMVTISVDPSVQSFNQLQVGDKVNMSYYESVAIAIGPKGQLPSETVTSRVGRGPAGTKPQGYAIESTDAVAVVKAIDRKNRTVSLQGPMGNMLKINVPKDMQGFNQLKVGDTVNARYTEAMAISVQKP